MLHGLRRRVKTLKKWIAYQKPEVKKRKKKKKSSQKKKPSFPVSSTVINQIKNQSKSSTIDSINFTSYEAIWMSGDISSKDLAIPLTPLPFPVLPVDKVKLNLSLHSKIAYRYSQSWRLKSIMLWISFISTTSFHQFSFAEYDIGPLFLFETWVFHQLLIPRRFLSILRTPTPTAPTPRTSTPRTSTPAVRTSKTPKTSLLLSLWIERTQGLFWKFLKLDFAMFGLNFDNLLLIQGLVIKSWFGKKILFFPKKWPFCNVSVLLPLHFDTENVMSSEPLYVSQIAFQTLVRFLFNIGILLLQVFLLRISFSTPSTLSKNRIQLGQLLDNSWV